MIAPVQHPADRPLFERRDAMALERVDCRKSSEIAVHPVDGVFQVAIFHAEGLHSLEAGVDAGGAGKHFDL